MECRRIDVKFAETP